MFKIALIIALLSLQSLYAVELSIPPDLPMAQFAAEKIQQAAPRESTLSIKLTLDDTLKPQAYSIQSKGNQILIKGGDARGVMYGGLELAERFSFGENISNLSIKNEPFIKKRGLKMNIPLDARCPSYDDTGTSATMNIEQVWTKAFWYSHLDRMAENRYNTLTLWNNHPFTAMLKLEQYPDVAINDIALPTYPMDDQMLLQYKQAELQDPQNYKIVKKMPIEEKITFWQDIMHYAKNRGIDIYFITWNIWVHGAEGKYGINTSQTNEQTIAYMRECVKQFILTYPDLKGMGITCGEHMENKRTDSFSVIKWMWSTYGQGIVDAKAEHPNREVHFIHRIWYSSMNVMMDDFISKYPDPLALSFKYARARLYSIPNPTYFNQQLAPDLKQYNLKSWANLRNDDIYMFRWGNPDYVRDFINNLPDQSLLEGFYMGSDGYVWGREFTDKDPQSPRQLEIDKHWYKFLSWGRLGYDPSLDHSFFEKKLSQHFPQTDAPQLYSTWKTASQIIPLINTWHWRDWDHMWSPEICMSKKEGYHSINHFIEIKPLNGQPMQSIPDFVKHPDSNKQSPLNVADQLDQLANETSSGLKILRTPSRSKELEKTLNDLECFTHLAHYYADKIRGSVAIHQYRIYGNNEDQQRGIKALEDALSHWTAYGTLAASLYTVQLYARTSYTDWNGKLLEHAKADIRIAKEAKHGIFPPSVFE